MASSLKATALLRGSDGIPLYVQVREKLRENLTGLAPGARIPSENDLSQNFSVSRITIRRAIDDLVSEGLLARRQGKGTFYESPKLIHDLNAITSWTDQLKALGYTPRTSSLRVAEIPAPRQIAEVLQLAPDETVVQIRRTRLANEEPLSLMVNYLPAKLVPEIAKYTAKNESLYELLASRYHLFPAEATDTVETRPATEAEAERLGITPWSPVLVVTRISSLASGQPLEMAVVVSRGDRYEYRVKLSGQPTSVV